MKKGLFSMVFAFATVFVSAQCDPVNSIDENFDTWEGNPFGGEMGIGDCWSTVSNGGLVYGEQNVTFYSFNSPNLNMFLISPEIVAGTYTLSFDASTISMDGSQSEGVSVQVGTVTSNADVSSYTTVSDSFSLTNTPQTIQIPITFTAEAKYIAVKISTVTPHSAAGVDNFVLAPETAGVNDLNAVKVQAYPNPVVSQLNLTAEQNLKEVSIFNATGQLIQTAKLNGKSSSVNVSALKAGVYIVQITTEKGIQTLKVLKK